MPSAHARIWALVAAAAVAFVWVFRPILAPFLVGIAVAYLLDPLVARLSARGIPRAAAAAVVLAAFVAVVATAAAVAAPIVGAQATGLVERVPAYGRDLGDMVTSRLMPYLHAHVDDATFAQVKQSLSGASSTALSWLGEIARGVLAGGGGIVSVISVAFIAPVVSFYLMRDWPRLLAAVADVLPRRSAPLVAAVASEIDGRVSAFFRGQGLVALALATFYSLGLSLVGLEFGFVVGLAAGLLSFIPYVGLATGVVVGGVLSVVQFQSAAGVASVLAVFAAAQFLDAGFLTPKLVGERVGLHPVWIIFAVMGGSVVAGFVGVLLAVPTAAAAAVVVSRVVAGYKSSSAYTGAPTGAPNAR
jgi:predicted PurR-regulated permease PerM